MAEVEVFGTKVQMPEGKTLMLLLAGGAAIGLFMLSRKPQPAAIASGAVEYDGGMSEYLQVVAEAAPELARIASDTRIAERQLELQLQAAQLMGPRDTRTCLTWETWNSMSKSERDRYNKQVRQGKALLQPSLNGPCFQPTQSGLGGHQPYVSSESRQGFLSSSKKIRGPAGSFQPQDWQPGDPAIGGIIEALLPYLFTYGLGSPTAPTGGVMRPMSGNWRYA